MREYQALDEPPCKMEVRLKEFSYDPLLKVADIQVQEYLAAVSREMRTLRRIRHPYVECVIGHFHTGNSLIQVSDWFDGPSIEESWTKVASLSLEDKLTLMIQIAQAIAFCHSKGVFHRNMHAGNVLVGSGFDEIRVGGFQFAKDLKLTKTVLDSDRHRRNPHIIPPKNCSEEELTISVPTTSTKLACSSIASLKIKNGPLMIRSSMPLARGLSVK